VNEVELSSQEAPAIEARLNTPAGQDILLATLQLVGIGSLTPDEALQHIRHWLYSGQTQEVVAELTRQYQLA
jgi:hypothetical protein